ncbi:MAG TPA: hypothetical protein VFB59_00350 [Candidatus Saccharimonadales bacterium]|nr:hypothetical protein [Candidatus Saccharimonadales bacterium]
MTPEVFLAKVTESVAESDFSNFECIGGPDLVDRPDYQAALYSGFYIPAQMHKQVLFLADKIPGSNEFGQGFLTTASIASGDEGYHIEDYFLPRFRSIGAIVVKYPK